MANGNTKTLFTLCVDDYEPDITALTFPLLRQYADKIDAKFHVISERKFPDYPPVYEKFQIYSLANSDWNIYFDADTLIHPDFFDVTAVLAKDTTCSYGSDFTPHRFKPDMYFSRDARWIGKGNWCMIASDWCVDVWRPLTDLTMDEAVGRIYPTRDELAAGVDAAHLIDDFLVSRNISMFGLKHVLIPDIIAHYQAEASIPLLWHQYLMPPEQKVVMMRKALAGWGVEFDRGPVDWSQPRQVNV
jgi:hypothetical protein